MEDSWICVDDADDDCSSHYSLTDSDKIDSETEAELYSKIHYEEDLSCIINSANENATELSLNSAFKDTFCNKKNKIAPTSLEHKGYSPLGPISCNNFSSGKRKSSEINPNCIKTEENLSSKKFKSSIVADSSNNSLSTNDGEYVTDSLQTKLNDIQNEKIILISNLKNESDKKNDTVLVDSNDSDSDIWIESDCVDKTDLKINLIKNIDTILLSSSDSDNESDITSPLVRRNSILKNLSMPNIEIDGNSKDLWHINNEDLHRTKRYSHRYHEDFDITCSNCNRKGHTFRSCPSPKVIKCFVCGGRHVGARCFNRMCSNCYTSGHDRKNCWRKTNTWVCHLCKKKGHSKGNCPDLWRRYHLTTSNKIKKGNQDQEFANLYCWNCGKRGHFGGACPVSHLSKNGFSTWPCVISYASPKRLLKARLFEQGNSINKDTARQNELLNSPLRASEQKNTQNFNSENRLSPCGSSKEIKGSRTSKKRMDLRFNKVQNIVKESDFPRTPKEKSQIRSPAKFESSGSAPLLMKKCLKKLKQHWKRRQNKRNNIALSQDDASEKLVEEYFDNSEDNVPELVIKQTRKRFNRWKRNNNRRIRRKQTLQGVSNYASVKVKTE